MVVVDPEPVLGTLFMRREYTLSGMENHTHSFTLHLGVVSSHASIYMKEGSWRTRRKPTWPWGEHVKLEPKFKIKARIHDSM